MGYLTIFIAWILAVIAVAVVNMAGSQFLYNLYQESLTKNQYDAFLEITLPALWTLAHAMPVIVASVVTIIALRDANEERYVSTGGY